MARRRKSNSEAGVSLDSLMDALTNVVAVLILVLLLVQADVTRTVQKFIDDLKPATPEQIEEARVELARVEKQRDRWQELLKEDAPQPAALDAERRQIALLEKSLEESNDLLAELKEVRELEKKLRVERDIEAEKSEKLQAEIARLEALLDSTPEKLAKPDIVSIPNSRPIPAAAKVYYALVFGGRVHLIDPYTPLDLFADQLRQNKNDWIAQRIKRRGGDRILYNRARIVEHFKDFDFNNRRGQKVEIFAEPHWTRLRLRITPDKASGGTTTAELEMPQTAPFGDAVKSLARVRNAVLMFWVNPDSFDTYLKARPLADAVNLPAGWEVRWDQNYTTTIEELEIQPTAKPPKPPAKPPAGPQPPKLDPRLD